MTLFISVLALTLKQEIKSFMKKIKELPFVNFLDYKNAKSIINEKILWI